MGLHHSDFQIWSVCTHIEYVRKKLSKTCGIILKLRHCVGIDILKTLYYALGYSYLRYGNIVWGNAVKTTLKTLVTRQNRIIKIMTFAPFGRADLHPIYEYLKNIRR